ncbi:MAG: outer membrane protein transport protein [Burkholderiales bacterium]|nr:outer membrane protein transport protein [Burkholderiales bacterium]
MTSAYIRARHPAVATLTTIALAAAAGPALSAGFALQENSGSGLGNAYAGGAAAAEDASTVWANPAGMSRLGQSQVAGALNLIKPSLKFSNANSVAAAQQPLGNNGGDAGSLAAVPNLYFTMPIAPQWVAGIGVNAPFGLTTEYDDGWIGRFQGLKSDLMTINVNPAVSWQALPNLALGVGLNYQYLDATFTSNANYSAALLAAAAVNGIAPGSPTYNAIAQATPGLTSNTELSGSDHAWGWNLGVLFDIDKDHRLGAHYRSGLKYTVSGQVAFANPQLPALSPPLAAIVGQLAAGVNSQVLYGSGVTSQIELPEIVNVSYFGRLNERWDLVADLQYTGWSSIQALTFTRSDGSPLQSTTENFDDAWRIAVGVNYRHDANWLFRGGLAYDQSPVQDGFRTVRLPDADRTWLAGGARYQFSPQLWLDVGAAYLWVRSAGIDDIGSSNFGQPPNPASSGRVNGSYNNSTVILSGQLTYAF